MRLFRTAALLLLSGLSIALAQKPYFQQEVSYRIAVALNDKQHLLQGTTEFDYYNNSPDTLTFLYLHLWPNAYSSTQTAWAKQMAEMGKLDFLDAPDSSRGFIDSLSFRLRHWETKALNPDPLKLEIDPQNPDIAKVYLPSPLAPGQSLTLHTPFRVKIPADFSRMGHVGQGYQVTQWFPKPAVYDNTGWHQMPYLDQGEFYSEFGRFDVDITVPRNYRVCATGILANESEQKWLDSLAALGQQKQWTGSDNFPPSDPVTKTLHFSQTDVHDFGWFADKRYNVMKSKVALPNNRDGREVTTWTFFLNKHAARWQKAVAYVDSAVHYYSLWSGEYPYTAATAVEGALKAGGGMEYPMITVIADQGNDFSLDNVITHEVGHNWFYGILGTNERDFVWMDESVNTFFQDRIMMKKYPKATLGDAIGVPGAFLSLMDAKDLPYSRMNELAGTLVERSNQQQPLETPSADFTTMNYGALAYLKGAYLFRYMMFYLGEEKFDKAMHAYYKQCKFTHPSPADMKRVFEKSTGQDLTWFFHDLLQTREISDYALTLAQPTAEGWTLRVANHEKLAIPFSISALRGDTVVHTEWFSGFEGARMLTFPKANCDRFVLDYLRVSPEHNRDNNMVRTHGLFRTAEALQLRLGTGVENDKKNSLYVLPAIGWNQYNGFMAGAMLHNLRIPARHFNYYVMPMYAFGSNDLSGAAGVKYDILPQKGVQRIRFEVNAAKFGSWSKISPRISLTLMPKNLRTGVVHTFWADAHFMHSAGLVSSYSYPLNTYVEFDERMYSMGWLAHKKGKLRSYTIKSRLLLGVFEYYANRAIHQTPTFEFDYSSNRRLGSSPFRLASRFNLVLSKDYLDFLGSDPLMEQYNVDRPVSQYLPFNATYASFGNATNLPSLGYRQRFTSLGGTYSNPYYLFTRTTWPGGTDYEIITNTEGVGCALLQYELAYRKFPIRMWAEVLSHFDGYDNSATLGPITLTAKGFTPYVGAGLTFAVGKTLQIHAPLVGMSYELGTPQSFRQFTEQITFTLNLNPFQRPFDLPELPFR